MASKNFDLINRNDGAWYDKRLIQWMRKLSWTVLNLV